MSENTGVPCDFGGSGALKDDDEDDGDVDDRLVTYRMRMCVGGCSPRRPKLMQERNRSILARMTLRSFCISIRGREMLMLIAVAEARLEVEVEVGRES